MSFLIKESETLFKAVDHDFANMLQEAQSRIEQRSRLVDIESYAAKMELDQERHKEIKSLVGHIPMKDQKPVSLPYHLIPYHQNPTFFGRQRELKLCRDALNHPTAAASPRFFALYGIAGVGKTSVALSFAYEEKVHKPIVIWFTADSKEKLDKTFSRVAQEVGLQEGNGGAEQDRDAVKKWLEKTGMSVINRL